MRTLVTILEDFLNNQRQSVLLENKSLPRLLPLAKILNEYKHTIGFRVFNLDTHKAEDLTLGNILDLSIKGVNVAGITITMGLDCVLDGSEYEYAEPTSYTINTAISSYYNNDIMPTIDESGSIKYCTDNNRTLVGINEATNKAVVAKVDGTTEEVEYHELFNYFVLGIDISTGRIHPASIQPYKE